MHITVNSLVVEWDNKWLCHMALHNPAHQSIKSINIGHKWKLSRHCLQTACIYPPQLGLIVTSGNINSTTPVSNPLSLQCQFPLAEAKPSSCTATGKHCSILCCINLDPNIHFTQSLVCNFIFHPAFAANPSSQPTFEPDVPSHHSEPSRCKHPPTPSVNMPRTRHRMHSQRGGNRGKLSRSPPYLVFDTSSPSAQLPSYHYPNTRNGKGCSTSLPPTNAF